MPTGYIDIDGKYIKDGLKNDLSTTRLVRGDKWEKCSSGGYLIRRKNYQEYTRIVLGVKPKKVEDWMLHQVWWSEIPYKPYWKKKLLSYWLKFKDLFKRTKP